ncbi:MAG: hypothetical protein Q9166_003869 [cf. Caloplaca sp. 2 TL-2023]
MEHANVFHGQLQLQGYNFDDPIEAARCQTNVYEFMQHVYKNSFKGPEGKTLVDKFCNLVRHKEVCHLAEMVVPEFRMSISENDKDQRDCPGDYRCLNYVLAFLQSKDQLPTRNDGNHITTEQALLKARYKYYVKYIMTGGTGFPNLDPNLMDEIDTVRLKVQGITAHEAQQKSGRQVANFDAGE